jgi:hypothetical protein
MRKLFFIIMIYLPFNVNGQIRGANHIGSIGSMGTKKIVFSGPIIINDSSCFTISNGVKTLKSKTISELFKLKCELIYNQPAQITLFSTYPNPANNFTTLKFINKDAFINLKEIAIVQLYDNSGNLYNLYKTTFFDITNGYKINLSNLISGNYYIIIQVGDLNYQQVLKIFKN